LGATGAGVGFGGLAGFAAIAAKLTGAGFAGTGAGVGVGAEAGAAGVGDAAAGGAASTGAAAGAEAAGAAGGVAGAPTLTSCLVFGLTILIALLADFTGGVEGDDGGFMPGGLAYAGTPIGGTPIIMPILNGALPGVNI
tara:strand:+ start:2843 stop:3259 length:417 start_codon:yes stop_codon:yes gene_type:complete